MVQSSDSHCCRRIVEKAVLFLTGMVIFHAWFVEGLPVFCQVEGGSMATTLLGSHVDWTCPACRFPFACDAFDAADATRIVCPNCGASFSPSGPPAVLSGDRVLIDRTAFQFRPPRRWEVAAFDRTVEGGGLTVKRVVGLPGETIRIINGDVYAGGKLQRKDLWQQRATRVLVYDDDYPGPSPRWRPQDLGSNWTRRDGLLVHAENPNDDIGWLVYNHEGVGGDASQRALVTDYGYYNRGRLQRSEDIHPTADVAMSFRMKDLHGRGLIWLQATDGRDEFMAEIDPGGKKFTILKNRKPLPGTAGSLSHSLRGETIEVSLIDRQFLFAVGGKTLIAMPIETADPPPVARLPLAIGVKGLGMVIDHLRVYRDVYYTEPPFSAARGTAPSYSLGAGEFFVLGDNSPISEDSRTWSEGRFVTRNSLAGKPLMVIYPACRISLAGWHIQVPDPTRIRYIR